MYENIATPKTSIKEVNILSKSLLGLKSPKPTVDNDVNAKYKAIIVIDFGSLSSKLLYVIKNS